MRSREGNSETTDLNAVVGRIVENQQTQWEKIGLQVDFRPARQALEVSGDPEQLELVTANVIQRAEDMLDSVGVRTLRISTNTLSTSALITIIPGKSATPRDNSPEAMVSAQPSSPRGLRISVCKSLVEGMGGALRLDEEAARGFSLEIEYPLAAARWTPKKFSTVQHRQGGNSNRPPHRPHHRRESKNAKRAGSPDIGPRVSRDSCHDSGRGSRFVRKDPL